MKESDWQKVFRKARYIFNRLEYTFDARKTKPIIAFLEEYFKDTDNLIGAEVGVYRGTNAHHVLKSLPIKRLYLIDICLNYAKKLLGDYVDKIVWLEMNSDVASSFISDESLDFVYIDGSHEYKYVIKDLEYYYPKIKPDGVFTGDDFWMENDGVVKAVTEFITKYNLKINGKGKDWWIIV